MAFQVREAPRSRSAAAWLFGDLPALRRDALAFFSGTREAGDLVRLRFGRRRNFYVLHNPEAIREVLVAKSAAFHKGRGLDRTKILLGEGLLTSEGETHRKHRRMIQPHFSAQNIPVYADQIVEETLRMVGGWVPGEDRIISSDMMALTLNVIAKTMFGTQIDRHEAIRAAVDVALHRVIENLRAFLPGLMRLPTKRKRELQASIRLLNETIYSIIANRRAQAAEGEVRSDLLAVLLAATDDEGVGLSDEELRDEVMTIFLAGHETTAHTLSWTWVLLSRHPEVERKFHEELDRVLAGRTPGHADLRHLTYTTQILQEAMRLYPAAWLVTRKAVEEVRILDHTFLPGDRLFMCQYAMHRDPRYFDEPEVFRPERFAGDLPKRIPPFAYFPFGGGPRVCIGNHFAMMEAALILAAVGQRFRLRLAGSHPPIVPEPLITLRPRHDIRMRAEPR